MIALMAAACLLSCLIHKLLEEPGGALPEFTDLELVTPERETDR